VISKVINLFNDLINLAVVDVEISFSNSLFKFISTNLSSAILVNLGELSLQTGNFLPVDHLNENVHGCSLKLANSLE
jgi:hypothetical protein